MCRLAQRSGASETTQLMRDDDPWWSRMDSPSFAPLQALRLQGLEAQGLGWIRTDVATFFHAAHLSSSEQREASGLSSPRMSRLARIPGFCSSSLRAATSQLRRCCVYDSDKSLCSLYPSYKIPRSQPQNLKETNALPV